MQPSRSSAVDLVLIHDDKGFFLAHSIISDNSKNWLRLCLSFSQSLAHVSSSHHLLCFFFYLGFLSRTLTIHSTAGEGEAISLTPLYHFQPLHRHLDVSQEITAESSPLHIDSSLARTGNFWFPSAS